MPLNPDPAFDNAEKDKLLHVRAVIEELLRAHDICADDKSGVRTGLAGGVSGPRPGNRRRAHAVAQELT